MCCITELNSCLMQEMTSNANANSSASTSSGNSSSSRASAAPSPPSISALYAYITSAASAPLPATKADSKSPHAVEVQGCCSCWRVDVAEQVCIITDQMLRGAPMGFDLQPMTSEHEQPIVCSASTSELRLTPLCCCSDMGTWFCVRQQLAGHVA